MEDFCKLLSVVFILSTCEAFAQKMTVEDNDGNILMEVNDEGSVGSLSLPSGPAPGSATNKLYNVGGVLYWQGNALLSTESSVNADQVDNFHASSTPEANKLLALDGDGKFPSYVFSVEGYDSGWFLVSKGTTLVENHDLGSTAIIFKVYFDEDGSGSNMREVINTFHGSAESGYQIKNLSATSYTLQVGGDDLGRSLVATGDHEHLPRTGYYRIIGIAID